MSPRFPRFASLAPDAVKPLLDIAVRTLHFTDGRPSHGQGVPSAPVARLFRFAFV